MGFFSKITKKAKKFFTVKEQKRRITNVGTVLKQSFNPFSKVKPTVSKKVPKIIAKPLKALVKHPYTSALAVATVASSVGRKVLKKAAVGIARSATKTPLRSIATATTLPVATGLLIKSKKARKITSKAVEAVTIEEGIRRGGVVAGIIEGEQKESIVSGFKKAGKYGAIAAGGVAAVALGGLVVSKVLGRDEKVPTLDPPVPTYTRDLPVMAAVDSMKQVQDPATTPTTPETVPITSIKTPSTKRRRRRKPSKPLKISQKVSVIVKQSQNKRYININNY